MAKKTSKITVGDLKSSEEESFIDVLRIIENAKRQAYSAVNRELINMYWEIGAYVSNKIKSGVWGENTVQRISEHIQTSIPNISGFSASNIWRMKQFYEAYVGKEFLATLLREISWSKNLLIMQRAKTDEERHFYLTLAANNHYSHRELERQIDSLMFQRTQLSEVRTKPFLAKGEGLKALRDNYILEFLDVSVDFKEKDLRKAIVSNIKNFFLEFGKDFAFIGEEYKVQVGNTDFSIDLVFYNRALKCLVAIELKTTAFKPQHLGQLEFYLEALDRDVKKADENPSVGLILCADKDDVVVEYALRRSMSPALIADYKLKLPNKDLLENKIAEMKEITASIIPEDED